MYDHWSYFVGTISPYFIFDAGCPTPSTVALNFIIVSQAAAEPVATPVATEAAATEVAAAADIPHYSYQ